jgi:uncharacterized membrane protein (UPF0127 family)
VLVLIAAFAMAAPPQPACVTPAGARIVVEPAITDEERALGLMFRDSLPEDHGMLFVFDADGTLPFWMKNTFIPLDFVWLSGGGEVVEVLPDVPPCRLDPCPSYSNVKPARAMLELNAGAAARLGLKPGVRLRCEGVPAFPVRGGAR